MVWKVVRTDDNGNAVTMACGLSENEARILVKRMEIQGHKQTYEAVEDKND